MKILKSQLKQIIKEELEVTLTNEEAGEMFGEAVETQLGEQQLNEIDPSLMTDAEKVTLILQAIWQMGVNFSPAIFGAVAVMAARRGLGLDKEEDIQAAAREVVAKAEPKQDLEEMQGHPGKCCDTAHPDEEHEDYMDRITIRLAEDDQAAAQPKLAGDVERATKKLGQTAGLESVMASINTRQEFEQMLMQFIKMVAKEKLKPQDIKAGIKRVAQQVLQSK